MKKTIILTTVNDNLYYQNNMKVFLQSLKENAAGEFVRIYVVNNEKIECELKKINKNIEIKHINEKLNRSQIIIRNALYCHEALKEGYEKVAWIDSDVIIRAKLGDFWDVKPCELKVIYRRKKKDHIKFQSGVFVIGNSSEMRKYIWKWAKTIIDLKKAKWYDGQELMCELVLKYKIKQIDMPIKYNDSKFNADSVIWHCKSSHFSYEKYQKEYRKYLEVVK
ncbi:MAG: hypothetical protein GY853_13755 [PVC group bacterium]|nr:hypothetical protein [PVC group bacterium]